MTYRGSHQPFEDGDPIHALSSQGTLPPDVYEHPEWYGWGEFLPEMARLVRSVRGVPSAQMQIFRAVPPGIDTINTGDWVSIVEPYARLHAIHSDRPEDDWPVISAVVRANQIRTGGGDLVEWGYWGEPVRAELASRKE